jgi:sugar phosphate isomerase/epimerase
MAEMTLDSFDQDNRPVAGGAPKAPLPLVLWAACVASHDILARADAIHAGEFSGMSVRSADLAKLEQSSGLAIERIASELRAREAPIIVIDPYFGWYPDWQPATGPRAELLNTSADAVLRYADALAAQSVTLVTPFAKPAAPRAQVVQGLGEFADTAAQHGLRVHLEPVPTSAVPDLATAWTIIREVDRPNAGLVLDTFHLTRSRTDPALLDAIPHEKVFHLQLCDGPLHPAMDNYLDEASTCRTFPGDGEMPVAQFVQRLIRGGSLPPTGPEIFSPSLAHLTPAEAGRACARRTRDFLASLGVAA